MANKKKAQPQPQMSPERFIREKARSLEIGPCYISADIDECGEGAVIVTRLHKGGKYTVGLFLLDIYCLGVVDVDYDVRMSEYDYETFIHGFSRDAKLKEISYNEAHNRIYGAMAFAEDAGIAPCKAFGVAQYILEEDDERIPLIDYEYGKGGKHYLVAYSQQEADRYLPILRKNLGEGNFDYIVEDSDDDDEDEGCEYDDDEHPYTYKPTRIFPKVLYVENPRALEIIKQEDFSCLTDEEVDEILALPQDSLRKDMEDVILYALGQWWKKHDADNYEYFNAVCHALMILGEVGDEGSLDVVLELLRMDPDFIDGALSDVSEESVIPAIVCTGQNQLDVLFDFMKEVGLDNRQKGLVSEAVRHIGLEFGQRDEVLDWFRTLLRDIAADYPNAEYTDDENNGFIVWDVMYFNDKSLLPDIKKLYDIEFIDETIVGEFHSVEESMGEEANNNIYFGLKLRYRCLEETFNGD